ncbi:taste receptor type 2 member 39-like [Engystomops pustulosus]|uniref:taste receptor type 2 member 39-like n=1 Tax=Engystomops pustulosus TaxID=76066 RepID=UPI003AFAFA63
MSSVDVIALDCIILVEIFGGLLINGFITTIKILDWWECQKMKPLDKLFLGLGLSRFLTMCLYVFNIINRFFSLNVYQIKVLNWTLNTICLFLDFSSLWFSMWLSVLYYVKVAIFKSNILIRIKLRLSELVPYMILSSIFISLVSGFLFAYNFSSDLDIMIPYSNMDHNQSEEPYLEFAIPSYIFGHFIPFIIVSISTFFLIQTILVHMRHISSNASSLTPPRMNAHHAAIHSVMLLELMTVLNLVVSVLHRFDVSDTYNNASLFLFVIAYPVFHSLVLIAGNAKLRKAAMRFLCQVKECRK